MDVAGEIEVELAELERRDLRRHRRTIGGAQGPEVRLGGRRVICLASNNYLGLAADAAVIAASREALDALGLGSGASPLVSGHMEAHEALEREIAEWLGCEASLLFGSGYHANIGTIAALVGRGDEVFSDELNHASLIDGCRLARARVTIYRHGDAEDLGVRLSASRARRRLVVTDSVFSMDGDRAPLAAIAEVAERHGAWVMVDEAHAIGVLGGTGAGLVEELELGPRIAVRMGTLGKALGGYGAFVAGSRALIELLVNRARAYVFSTALPAAVVAGVRAAVAIARSDGERRARLWRNAERLREGLRAAGLGAPALGSSIVPLVLGEPRRALAASRRLLEAGVLCPAIRPPTVPEGTARLRLTPIATHGDEQIDRAVEAIAEAVAASVA